jgi:hypothetical protein
MRPASTAIPVETPSSVGKSDARPDKSAEEFTPGKGDLIVHNSLRNMNSIYLVCKRCAESVSNASQHGNPLCRNRLHCDLFADKQNSRRYTGRFGRKSIVHRVFLLSAVGEKGLKLSH